MRILLPTVEGRLLRRYKRFLADVALPSGEVLTVHCPNTGSLLGCTPEGARAILRDSQDPNRKLRYTLQTVRVDGTWVNVDTGLPNALVSAAIPTGAIPELTGYPTLRREVKYGRASRVDILLAAEGEPSCYVEVKSTTLAESGVAMFPDAVTTRGRKHLEELSDVVRDGGRAVIFFCVSRADVTRFRPAEQIDPRYAAALREAVEVGVEPLAYSTRVKPRSFEIGERLEISLETARSPSRR